ncbi:MAG: carboxypeptidase regulatory-like domain-containing protein [Candidatus Hydrogenedentes bacterium]|nr:carboxypeptidase regulatory-like domain-containing protein [Candidatus Hydrogenedentota bacterium]
MNLCAIAVLIASLAPGAAVVSGTVTGSGGQPIAGARVFLEPGLGGTLSETESGADGSFAFDAASYGLVGVFAIADGYAFGGLSKTIAVHDDATGLRIVLQPEGAVSGKVTDMKGEPIAGARVTRVLLMGESPVGIPFAKLSALGFEEPVSDSEGRFTAGRLPHGGKIALKVGHTAHAQAGIQDVAVGSKDVRVQLSPGVLVQGTVLSRDGERAVANAAIILRSATPPHDTAVTKTDLSGSFSIRLNPGYYLYQAASVELRSPGWEKLTITGREPSQRVTLRVAGTAKLIGDVRDAETKAPIPGARLSLVAFGSPVAAVTTGSTGGYEFIGAEGENIVRVEAAPGYAQPERPYLTLQVEQGGEVALPTFWLVKLPAFRLQVIDETEAAVEGALVRIIRPGQYACHVTGPDGTVVFDVASLPQSGRVVGMAEHPTRNLGALFSMGTDRAADARVQVLPLAKVSGTIVSSSGKSLPGATVGALFQEDADDEPLPLWRTVAGKDGLFAWSAAVPYLPMVCIASAGGESYGRSMNFNLEPDASADLGKIVVPVDAKSSRKTAGKSLLGEKLNWRSGQSKASETVARPSIILYAPASESAMALQMLATAGKAPQAARFQCVLVCDGPVSVTDESILVLQGTAPGTASTYVLDAKGTVVLETWGFPPLSALATIGAEG